MGVLGGTDLSFCPRAGGGLERPVPLCFQVQCCGWVSFYNWTENPRLMNHTNTTYPCSCKTRSQNDSSLPLEKGFCHDLNGIQGGNNPDAWPVYHEVCGRLWAGRGWSMVGSDPPSLGLAWAVAPLTFTELAVPASGTGAGLSLAPSSGYWGVYPSSEHPAPSLQALRAGGGPSW